MRFWLFFLLLIPFVGNAQKNKPKQLQQRPLAPCSLPGMLPTSAIAVCGTTVFNQPNVTACQGTSISSTACPPSNFSDNAFWYKFHCYQAGTLGFLITPLQSTDDFDWEIFDVTGIANLNDVYTNTNLMVSINLFGDNNNGPTGCTPIGIDSINCGGNTNIFNRLASLQSGHDYLLMVNNYTNSGQGYRLAFGGGTAVITDNTPPIITSVASNCNTAQLKVNFSKDIKCDSVTISGSEFSITNGTHVVTGVTSNCTTGFSYITELTINLQNPLSTGNYVLHVNNGTDGNTFADACDVLTPVGFQIPFSVVQQTPIDFTATNFTSCAPTYIDVDFNKPFLCSSLTPTGSEFSILPGNPTISSANVTCVNGRATGVRLNLANPLPWGNYNLIVNNGTDGNTISDTCNIDMAAGLSTTINIPQPTIFPKFDSVQFAKCTPNTIRAFYSRPIRCASVAANGSDFFVTGPSAVTVIAATPDVSCAANGYTNWIDLQLSQPITLQGLYNLNNRVGTDGNGILDTCFSPQNSSETISMDILGQLNPVFNSTVQWDCVTDTIVLSHPGGNGINSWEWTFSDGTTQTGQTVTYLAATTTPNVSITLKVDNGFCNEIITQSVPLGNYFKPAISLLQNDTTCIGTPVAFVNETVGGIGLQHLWQLGDATIFNGTTPPAHLYTMPNTYSVRLIVNDMYGCIDTANQQIVVTPSAFIDINGVKPQYCVGQTLQLTKTTSQYIDNYTWNNDDGKTWDNIRTILFKYNAERQYNITLTGIDRFCGVVTANATTNVFAIPQLNLGNDTVLCRDNIIQLGTAYNAAYTYQWNSGETSSTIFTTPLVKKYSLEINNNGCKVKDEINIKTLNACVIKMPTAFTPNGDGKNDVLRATDADLAKAFKLNIYNRVGELIYTTQNPIQGWDGNYKGQPADPGTYVWELSYISPWTGKAVYEKGTSILIK